MKKKGREVLDIFKKFSVSFKDSNNLHSDVSINGIDDFVGSGRTLSFFNVIDFAYIGIKELNDDVDGYVDDYMFMKAFIALLHEYTHVYHKEKLLEDDSKTAKFIALNYLSGGVSRKYYDDNYRYMPNEIAAQYSAVKNGYKILSEFMTEDEANDLICMYANEHKKEEFIGEFGNFYSDINEIFDDYEKAFELSKDIKRKFNLKEYKKLTKSKSKYDNGDIIMRNIKNNTNMDLLEIMEESDSGIYQDLIGAYLYIQSDNSAMSVYANFNALSDIDLIKKSMITEEVTEHIEPVDVRKITPEFFITDDNLSGSFKINDFDMFEDEQSGDDDMSL